VRIWDEWADEAGDLGPVYGKQWRAWPPPTAAPLTRSASVLDADPPQPGLAPPDRQRLEPGCRRSRDMALAARPLPHLFQFYVADGRLSCQLYQRSADIFLGVPFNIASYALLTLMVAQVTVSAGRFRAHLRRRAPLLQSHRAGALQLSREPFPLPRMRLNPAVTDLFAFRFRGLHAGGLPVPSAHQGAGCGVNQWRVASLKWQGTRSPRPASEEEA
jgi:thymidylate synthase